MSQNNVWRFHQIRKIGLEAWEKQATTRRGSGFRGQGEGHAAGTAETTTGARRNSSQETSTCPLRPRAEARLVDRFTFESFWQPLMWHWGIPTVGLWTTLICLLQNICTQLVCLSLNKTWFLYTAIIELASGIHASLLHYQVNGFLGFWLMPKYMILESKESHKHSEPSFWNESVPHLSKSLCLAPYQAYSRHFINMSFLSFFTPEVYLARWF